MKQLLLSLSLLATTSMALQAQTASNPLTLEIGTNTYEYSGGYTTPVWIYTAPEDQLITIKPNSSVASITVTADGNVYGSQKLPSVKYNSAYLLIVQKDVPVYLNVTGYSSPVTMEASAQSYPYQLGVTADEAIEIKADGNAMFVPFREENYKEVPVHLKYKATEDGTLEMVFLGYVHNAYFAEGVDGEFTGITCKSSGSNYRTSIPVEEGKEYIVRLSSTTAKMLTAQIVHPVYGESADYPFILTGTDAEIPAKAGKYYYEVTGTESGYCVVSSDITDFDGSVSWGRSVESSVVTISDGSFDIRQTATLGGHYYVIVDKNSATAEAQKFQVRFEKRQPYDDFDSAANIDLEKEINLPPYPGTYYYRITTPSVGAYVLEAGPVDPFTDGKSSISLYSSNNYSTAKYIGDPDIYCEVEAASEYVLKVTTTEADKRTSVIAALSELSQGDGASNPFVVKIGQNDLPTGDSKYYLYESEKNSWVIITPADNSINAPIVKRLKNAQSSYEQTTTILRHGDGHRFEAEKGYSYLIRFTKIKEATTFDFAVPDYAQGESKDNPYILDGNSLTIPSLPGTYWWSYTAERDGKLHMTTDFKYDVVSSPTRENSVKLISYETGTVLTSMPIDYNEEVFNATTYNVEKGKKYFIQVTSVSEQEGKTVALEITDLDPGESPAVAIEIKYDTTPFEYYFPKLGARPDGKWYFIDLQEGDLSILTSNSISMYVYKEGDYEKSIGYASSFWNSDYTSRFYGLKDYKITAPGRYYFIIYYWYTPDSAVTFSGTALSTTSGIEEAVANGADTFTLNGNTLHAILPTVVYDLSGRLVKSLSADTETILSAGVYVVKSGNSTAKLMVK